MKKELLTFKETGNFSKKFLEFIEHDKESFFPNEKNILSTLSNINFSKYNRQALSSELLNQYSELKIRGKVNENIKSLLSENTYTITTGHQLNICTGPMYVIYKILSAIKLAHTLSKKYPEYNFVPVYWMASEDHDFEEIQSFHTQGVTHSWDIDAKGPVGNLDPSSLLETLNKIPSVLEIFRDAYRSSESLSQAVRKYMDSIFGDFGLVVIDPNSKVLKESIQDIIEDDIINNSIETVENSSKDPSDVHVRKINFFYQESQLRERIVKDKEYKVLSTNLSFSEDQIRNKIAASPESFSPNVITRCLYQQRILPNICYVGGPAEILYWLSFKKFFNHYNIDYPVLVPRDFVLLLTPKIQKICYKLNLETRDLFLQKNLIENKVLGVHLDKKKNFSSEIEQISSILTDLSEKFGKVDTTMGPHVLATSKNMEKKLYQIEKRFISSLKKKNKNLMTQVSNLNNFIRPGNSIQERKENVMSFYSATLIGDLYNNLDPLDLNFKVLKI